MFHRETTQVEEVVRIVKQTATRAYRIHKLFKAEEEDWPKRTKNEQEPIDELVKDIDQMIRRRHLPWRRDGHSVTVELWPNGRTHNVQIERIEGDYIFSSPVLEARHVTKSNEYWRGLAHRAWRRNAMKELVTFAFDDHHRLIGLISQPVTTLDDEELRLYIDTVARECDRFEYILTGKDIH